MTTGHSEFNEVFFNDVFVPDDDVVGPVNGGWTVARATLGNESVSIGGGQGGGGMGGERADRRRSTRIPSAWPAGPGASGRYVADDALTDCSTCGPRTAPWSAAGPGPEGNVAKLVLSELGHEALGDHGGAGWARDAPYADGPRR